MALYFTLSLCAFLSALLVYRYDLYDREPWHMLVLSAGLGFVAMRSAGSIELVVLGYVQGYAAVAAVAAFVEELSRFVVIVAIALVFPRHFNDPMDGIVYGSMIGLGMAIEESFYLLGLLETLSPLLLPVELVRLLGHLVMAGILGFGVGLARTDVFGWRRKLIRCVLVAFALHFLWDWVALQSSDQEVVTGLQTLASIAIMSFGILFYGSLVIFGSKLSKERFAPDSLSTLWGWPFTVFFKRGKQ